MRLSEYITTAKKKGPFINCCHAEDFSAASCIGNDYLKVSAECHSFTLPQEGLSHNLAALKAIRSDGYDVRDMYLWWATLRSRGFSRRAIFKTVNKPFITERSSKPVKSTQAVFQQANLAAWKTASSWQVGNMSDNSITTPQRRFRELLRFRYRIVRILDSLFDLESWIRRTQTNII